MRLLHLAPVAAGALAIGACATTLPVRAPLAGSSWRLVEIQSMDDAQGVSRPGNADLYTLQFDTSGNATMKLDCNQGRAPYTARRTGATTGTLTFGPIASTRALCGPQSLGERLAQQLPFVRTYLVRDGRLNMSLFADGGIFVWERTGGR